MKYSAIRQEYYHYLTITTLTTFHYFRVVVPLKYTSRTNIFRYSMFLLRVELSSCTSNNDGHIITYIVEGATKNLESL